MADFRSRLTQRGDEKKNTTGRVAQKHGDSILEALLSTDKSALNAEKEQRRLFGNVIYKYKIYIASIKRCTMYITYTTYAIYIFKYMQYIYITYISMYIYITYTYM